MSVVYVGVEEAIARRGLRMVVVGGVPSPWGEAAKGVLHVKGIDWLAVRLAYDSEPLARWAGQVGGPVAVYDDEPPRAGWREILTLAERLAPVPALLPADGAARDEVLAAADDILGRGGLAWTRRLQLVDAGLNGSGGFSKRVASYLGRKYGHDADAAAAAAAKAAAMLHALSARLKARHAAGERYFFGNALSAVDIYSAATVAIFRPLPAEACAMDAGTRAAFETRDPVTDAALDPVLLAHRDMMYAQHLESPLSL